MSTRRQFLGTLGKALGAGGLLLPWSGKGALALPADLGKAAQLPVAPATPPVSSELLRLREVRRDLHDIYLWLDRPACSKTRQEAWRNVMVNQHRPLEAQIIGRSKPTWQDCVEIAEVAMHDMARRRTFDRGNPNCALVYAVLSTAGTTEVFIPEIGNFSLDSGPSELWGRSE